MLMPITISMTRFYHKFNLYRRFRSVLHHNSASFLSAPLLILLFSLYSCEESPTNIGLDNLPGKDSVSIKTADTLEVNAYTLYIDSSYTNNRTYSYMGRIYDPYFGDTRNDFVGQLRILQKWPGGGAFTVDSVRLYMNIAGAKGILDSTIVHQISLFEINEYLKSSVRYYSNRDPNAGMNFGTFPLPGISKDTSRTFVIDLPVSMGQYLMRDTLKLTQDEADEKKNFQYFFNGLYVKMEDSPDPLLMAIDYTSTNFVITVFYTNAKSGTNYYEFVMSTSSVRYNRYDHDFTTADPVKGIKHINDGVKDTAVYLQAFSGVFPQLRIPDLTYFKSLPTPSINKARLTFSAFLDNDIYKTTTLPPQIYMRYIISDSVKYIVPDYQVGTSFFDGTFNSTSKTYSFNLASFVQEYVEGRIKDPIVEMYIPEGEYKNVILKANNSLSPVKFEFIYSQF